MPERIQLWRTKGWRKPEGAVVVSRPSRWGNWYKVVPTRVQTERGFKRSGDRWVVVHTNKWGHETGSQFGTWDDKAEATRFAVELFRRSLEASLDDIDGSHVREFYLGPLIGRDLGCWCKPGAPCHADVLLELANS